jgi:two-component system response regulator RegX3
MTSLIENIRVLIAEDEDSFVDALSLALKKEGFTVSFAKDGKAALKAVDDFDPDIILLDIMLPKINGLDVCKTIRMKSNVPIIIVSARSSETDAVVGLELGADDYVIKPYRLKELVARIRAVLRRRQLFSEESSDKVIEIGEVKLDPSKREVTLNGEVVKLTLKEFDILHALLKSAGRVVTREYLIDTVWGSDFVGDTKTLDVHIKRLREKLKDSSTASHKIITIRGIGYKYELS